MLRLKNLTLMGLLGISLAAAEKIPIASWSFDQGSGGDEVRGFQKIVDGVAGKALRFDGQTRAGGRPAAGLPLYSWNHLLGTFDPASGLKLYLNGKLVGEKAASGPPRFAPEVDAWIGRNQTPLGLSEEIRAVAPVAFSFDGIIDEVRIYDVALTPSEAAAASSRFRPSGRPPLG